MKTYIFQKRWIRGLGIVLLLLLTVATLLWIGQRRAFENRPLVLIQSPLPFEEIRAGEALLLHSVARSQEGLIEMRVWINDQLVFEEDGPEDGTLSNLTISESWVPRSKGEQLLIVEAIGANGARGQASLTFLVSEGQMGLTHIATEGETLADIAASYGSSPQEISEANPSLGGGNPASGDEVSIPEEDGPPAPFDPPYTGEDEDEPPLAEIPAPDEILFLWGNLADFLNFQEATERLTLKLEISELQSSDIHDRLHCYLSIGDSPPQWYPDLDNDQASDESFEPLGEGFWDTAAGLYGAESPLFTWPGNQELPFSVSCVGVAGSLEALDLGQVALSIPPEEWDGTLQEAYASGPDGEFRFSFLISRSDEASRSVPLFLDLDMTPPSNVRLDEDGAALVWDYEPAEDEEAIHGFRIYLNGNLQWIEAPDARESRLPYEWFHPACGSRYSFSVTAFRVGFPDGPESLPGLAFVETPAEDCTREIMIQFVSLETFDLGGDGRYEDRHGDVGPAYGHFYANESLISFDGRGSASGVDLPLGLSHNTFYDLSEMSSDLGWDYSNPNFLIVDIPEGGGLEFGFLIMDEDSGRCRDSDDPGCHDLICSWDSPIHHEVYAGYWDRLNEGTNTSDDGRCSLAYEWGPAYGSPVGTGEAGGEPLPYIYLEDMQIIESSGQVQLELRNIGTATWPFRDLRVRLQTRAGEFIGDYLLDDFMLEPGQQTTQILPDAMLSAPFDVCAVIDPNDEVLELYERTGALAHGPRCPQLPDLVIDELHYEASEGNIVVTVRNQGDGALENRTIMLNLYLPGREEPEYGIIRPGVSIEPRAVEVLQLVLSDEATRDQLLDGYSVVINPGRRILESNFENNRYEIRPSDTIALEMIFLFVPYDARNTVEYHLDAYVHSGSESRQIAALDVEQDIDWGSCTPGYCVLEMRTNFSPWIEIFGDETLEVVASASHPGSLMESYTIRRTFTADERWGAGESFNFGCHRTGDDRGMYHWTFDRVGSEEWSMFFNICWYPD